MARIEEKILQGLLHNEEYLRKVSPFLQEEYFEHLPERLVVQEILKFFQEFNAPASADVIKVELTSRSDVSEQDLKGGLNALKVENEPINLDWLLERSEKFCKDKAVYNAILSSIGIIDGKDKNLSQDAIPKILQDALSVSFDTKTGHDYIEESDARFDFYHRIEEKVPFNLELMDKITNGGLSKKSLNVCLAATGAGKSLFMCHYAASSLMQGHNVLYITLEMAEEKIAERIDANLMNVTMDELKVLDRTTFNNKVQKISDKTQGKLVIKEYPTASAHSGHFRALLEELKGKRDFQPDVLIVDYLNICASARLKMGSSINSYLYIKSIAEELRGLAVEYNIPVLTATQTNRNGYDNSDVSLSDTSESFGLPATSDLMFALIRTEEMDEMDQLMIKQLKNRYADPSAYKRFVLGVDKSKMQLYDVEQSAQDGLSDAGQEDVPVFDQSKFGKRINNDEGFDSFKF